MTGPLRVGRPARAVSRSLVGGLERKSAKPRRLRTNWVHGDVSGAGGSREPHGIGSGDVRCSVRLDDQSDRHGAVAYLS